MLTIAGGPFFFVRRLPTQEGEPEAVGFKRSGLQINWVSSGLQINWVSKQKRARAIVSKRTDAEDLSGEVRRVELHHLAVGESSVI